MYYNNRTHAGILLAERLIEKYRYEDCAVVALSDGAVQVGEEIASQLHCILTMLLMEGIDIPGENLSFGGISQTGSFTYNRSFSYGEIEEYTSEFHGYLEDQKREAFQRINRLLGDGGIIDNDMLRDHVVILVSDGMDDTTPLDIALDFLKPIRTKKIVVVSPVASVKAVDRMHVAADELCVLSVKDNYINTNHYYTENVIPSHDEIVAKINQVILKWR